MTGREGARPKGVREKGAGDGERHERAQAGRRWTSRDLRRRRRRARGRGAGEGGGGRQPAARSTGEPLPEGFARAEVLPGLGAARSAHEEGRVIAHSSSSRVAPSSTG